MYAGQVVKFNALCPEDLQPPLVCKTCNDAGWVTKGPTLFFGQWLSGCPGGADKSWSFLYGRPACPCWPHPNSHCSIFHYLLTLSPKQTNCCARGHESKYKNTDPVGYTSIGVLKDSPQPLCKKKKRWIYGILRRDVEGVYLITLKLTEMCPMQLLCFLYQYEPYMHVCMLWYWFRYTYLHRYDTYHHFLSSANPTPFMLPAATGMLP